MSAVDEQPARAGEQAGEALPIVGYAELTVARVLPALERLSRPQLWQIREFERRHANRVAVLKAIDQAIDA